MIPDKYQTLLNQFAPTEEARQTLSNLIESIVEERTQTIQDERDNSQYYLDNTVSLLVELDKNGTVIFANEQVSRITGYRVDELIGHNWFELLIPADEQDSLKKVFARVIKGELEPAHYYENQIIGKSGQLYLIAWHNFYRSNPDSGEITGTFSSGEEITLRRRMEDELQQKELHYRQMFYANNAVKLVLNPRTGAIVDANKAACEYYGYELDTLLSMNISQINTMSLDDLLMEGRVTVAKQRTYRFQHRLASGEIREVEVYTGPMTIKGEDLQFSIVLDVSERERAKKALQLRELQFRTALNHFPNGTLVMFDTQLNCIIARGQMLFAGIPSPEDLEGQYLPDILPPGIWADAKSHYEDALQGQSSQRITGDDMQHVLEQFEPLYDEQQAIIGGLHLFQDMSHLRQYERIISDTKTQLETILDGIVDGVAIVSPDEHILYANDTAARIVGYQSEREMMEKVQGKLFINHTPCDEKGNFLEFEDQALYHALQGKTPGAQIIVFKNEESGKEIWTETKAKPILDEDGQVRFAVIILNDITRARQIEQFKMKAVEEQAQIKTLREYIASTTHDLSQPLSVINTAVYMLDKAIQDEQIQKRTASIKAQSLRMQSILQDIRQISVLDSISYLDFSNVDMGQLLRQIADYSENRIREQGKNFSYDCQLEQEFVVGNAQYLEQAITQLIQNAIDYSPEKGQISLRCAVQSGNIIIEVEDDGIGIHREHQEQIFERFYRVDKSRTASPTSGTGLGLSIASRIMELHGGDIQVESTPGQGSLFRLSLPVE